MARRSLPERTVDAWVAAAVCSVFPTALLWAPTPVGFDNWDFAAGLGDGKAFILEDKGTRFVTRSYKLPKDVHRIAIDRVQLDRYCDEIDGPSHPVFYVLPEPPWLGTPSGFVPSEAGQRFDSRSGPFTDWAWVIRCCVLRRALGERRSIDHHELAGVSGAMTLAAFLDGVADCSSDPDMEVRTGDAGTDDLRHPSRTAAAAHLTHTLGVFVPAPIDGWTATPDEPPTATGGSAGAG